MKKRETYNNPYDNLYREGNRDTLHSCHKLLLLVLNCLTICFAYALRSFIQFISFLFNAIQEFTDDDLTIPYRKRGFYLKNTVKKYLHFYNHRYRIRTAKNLLHRERLEIQAITLFIMTKR